MASSIVSDFRLTQRQLLNHERNRNTASTNNLIRGDATPSLSEYYIPANDGTSETSSRTEAQTETSRLIVGGDGSEEEATHPTLTNGDIHNDEDSLDNDESAALLVGGTTSNTTSM